MNIHEEFLHPITINEEPVQFEGEVLAIETETDSRWSTLYLRPTASEASETSEATSSHSHRPTEYAISPQARVEVGDLISAKVAWSDQRYILASPRTLRSANQPIAFDGKGQSDFFTAKVERFSEVS